MNTNLNPAIKGGVWLTDAHGQCLASIREAIPEQMHPGCVRMQTWPRDDESLRLGSGDWRVYDRTMEKHYCVQALSCRSILHRGCELVVTTLGEPMIVGEDDDEDYLVVGNHAPVLLKGLLTADSRCPSGPHIRCQITANHFANLPISFGQADFSSCGQHAPPQEADVAPGQGVHRWAFAEVHSPGSEPGGCLHARVIRLRQRATVHVRFHVALPKSSDGQAVLVGHTQAVESWASVPTQSHRAKPAFVSGLSGRFGGTTRTIAEDA